MSLTISTKTYSFDTNPTPDSARYIGPANSGFIKDKVELKRIAPKPTKDFGGVSRQAVKTVKSVLVGTVYRDLIAETTFSEPAGASPADVTSLRADHQSAVANAAVTTLVDNGKLIY